MRRGPKVLPAPTLLRAREYPQAAGMQCAAHSAQGQKLMLAPGLRVALGSKGAAFPARTNRHGSSNRPPLHVRPRLGREAQDYPGTTPAWILRYSKPAI